jgi:ATP adenylyltransferase
MVLGRDELAFVIMNRFPYSNGHVMVVPVRHVGFVENLSEPELSSMMKFVQKMVVVLKKTFNVDGVNIGINVGRAAGAGLEEHVHIHVVPRWFGDTNFMAVSGETRVISEHLLTSYKRLKSTFLETVL